MFFLRFSLDPFQCMFLRINHIANLLTGFIFLPSLEFQHGNCGRWKTQLAYSVTVCCLGLDLHVHCPGYCLPGI
jgi:hypothetical protein